MIGEYAYAYDDGEVRFNTGRVKKSWMYELDCRDLVGFSGDRERRAVLEYYGRGKFEVYRHKSFLEYYMHVEECKKRIDEI